MRTTIENFSVLTGWAGSGTNPPTAYALNAHPEFIADELSNSVIFKFPAGSLNKYIQKTISVDVSDYEECVFSIWSRNKTSNEYNRKDDFFYKIDFGGTGYYIPVSENFGMVNFYIGDLTTLSRIRITCLHNDEDYLIVSSCQAIKEQLPLDIFSSLKTSMRTFIDTQTQISCGTVTCSANATSVTVTGNNYFLERYAVIKITDLTNTEYHQIIETDGEGVYKFSSLYDGTKMLNSYTSANVYLYIPVEYGLDSTEVLLPGIIINGFTPESILRSSTLETVYDTFKDTDIISSMREARIFQYGIMVDCESRHLEITNLMSEYIRKFISKQKLWLNGQDCEIQFEGIPTYLEPVDPNFVIHKMQYIFNIEYKESIYSRTALSISNDPTIAIEISQ